MNCKLRGERRGCYARLSNACPLSIGFCLLYGAGQLLIRQCAIRRVGKGAMPAFEGVVA
jgi:hypothetical protein